MRWSHWRSFEQLSEIISVVENQNQDQDIPEIVERAVVVQTGVLAHLKKRHLQEGPESEQLWPNDIDGYISLSSINRI